MINDASIINVYNYNEGMISVPSHINPQGHTFYAGTKENPFILPLTLSEIRFINGQSKIFREGFLKFDLDIQEDVYKILSIFDWENILNEQDIEDMILNPTKEKLDKIVRMTSVSLLERIRNVLTKMKNNSVYDISQRVIDTIEYRHQELYRNIRKSEIEIHKTRQEMIEDAKGDVLSAEIEKIKADFKLELEKKIRAEIEAELKFKTEKSDENIKEVETKTEVVSEPKKPGRPSSK